MPEEDRFDLAPGNDDDDAVYSPEELLEARYEILISELELLNSGTKVVLQHLLEYLQDLRENGQSDQQIQQRVRDEAAVRNQDPEQWLAALEVRDADALNALMRAPEPEKDEAEGVIMDARLATLLRTYRHQFVLFAENVRQQLMLEDDRAFLLELLTTGQLPSHPLLSTAIPPSPVSRIDQDASERFQELLDFLSPGGATVFEAIVKEIVTIALVSELRHLMPVFFARQDKPIHRAQWRFPHVFRYTPTFANHLLTTFFEPFRDLTSLNVDLRSPDLRKQLHTVIEQGIQIAQASLASFGDAVGMLHKSTERHQMSDRVFYHGEVLTRGGGSIISRNLPRDSRAYHALSDADLEQCISMTFHLYACFAARIFIVHVMALRCWEDMMALWAQSVYSRKASFAHFMPASNPTHERAASSAICFDLHEATPGEETDAMLEFIRSTAETAMRTRYTQLETQVRTRPHGSRSSEHRDQHPHRYYLQFQVINPTPQRPKSSSSGIDDIEQ